MIIFFTESLKTCFYQSIS